MQLLLPLYDRNGRRFDRAHYDKIARQLTEKYGGVTAYARAPAAGLWKEQPGKTTRDDIVVYEVMVEAIDRDWWAAYRADLEKRFHQDELVVRAMAMERL